MLCLPTIPFRCADVCPLEMTSLFVTLDPDKFAEKKHRCLYIGNLVSYRPHVVLHHHLSPIKAPRLFFFFPMTRLPGHPRRYTLTEAFLYFYMSSEGPPTAGELRLPVASSDDHKSLENGNDLLKSNGQTRSHPLSLEDIPITVVNFFMRYMTHLLSTLVYIRALYPSLQSKAWRRYRSVGRFSKFGQHQFHPTQVHIQITIFNTPKLMILMNLRRALVRSERSTLPDHKDTRTVVIRFPKVITPVKCVIHFYDGYYIAPPQERELHRRTFRSFYHQVWSVNNDNPKTILIRGLRLLCGCIVYSKPSRSLVKDITRLAQGPCRKLDEDDRCPVHSGSWTTY